MAEPPPDPDSPFASFAQPKPSALKQFVERRQQSTQSSKAYWQYLGVAYAGTVIAAAVAVAIGTGWQHILLALAFGAVGALLGVPGGWLLAAISWAAMRNRMTRAVGPLGMSGPEQEMVRGNKWNNLLVWLTVWAALGMVCGAATGAMLATDPVSWEAAEVPLGWGMSGACLGLVLVTAGWLLMLRRARLAADKRRGAAMD
jgi:hypothetical protein